MADFTELAQRYLQARMNNVTQPFTDPGQYMEQRLGLADANVAPRIGPTVGASQGTEFGNPINQAAPQPSVMDQPSPNIRASGFMPTAAAATIPQPVTAPALPNPPMPQGGANINQAPPMPNATPASVAAQPRPYGSQVPAGPDYNQQIAALESGSNPNIGYHQQPNAQGQRQSTAYGTYGITAPAYQDIQQADPYFANRPITSLTADDQARANNVLHGVYEKQLQHFGVDPTEENTRLAHLLGAKGAADYLATGHLSPTAARFNGGEANLRRLAQERLKPGAPGQASTQTPGNGIVRTEAMAAAADSFEQDQQNPKKLAELAYSDWTDKATQRAAADQLHMVAKTAQEAVDVTKRMDAALADPTGRGGMLFAREMSKKGEEGSLFKAIFYSRLGLNDLAKAEQGKLGAYDQWLPTLVDGRQAWVKFNGQGAPVKGYDEQGELSGDQLLNAASMIGSTASAGLYQYKAEDGTMHTVAEIRNKTGQVRFMDTTTNRLLPSAPAGMEKLGVETAKTSPELYQYYDENGQRHVVEKTVKSHGGGITYRIDGRTDTTTPPANLEPIGKGDPLQKPAISAKKTAMDNMRKENAKAAAQRAPLPYTEEQILRAGEDAYNGVYQGTGRQPEIGGPGAAPEPVNPNVNGPTSNVIKNAQQHFANRPAAAPEAAAKPAGQTLAPELEAQAKQIANYEVPIPTGTGAANYRNRAIIDRVYQLNPSYDGQKFKENQAIIKDYSTGKANQSVQGLKTAFNHIDELKPMIKELNNGNYPAANKFLNGWATAVGKSNVTNVEQVGPIVAQEVMKTWNPSMGSVGEREEIARAFNSARSPKQLNDAIDNLKGLMMGKLKPLADKYESTGRRDFWSSQINDSSVKSTYDQWMAKENARHGNTPAGTTSSGVKWKVTE